MVPFAQGLAWARRNSCCFLESWAGKPLDIYRDHEMGPNFFTKNFRYLKWRYQVPYFRRMEDAGSSFFWDCVGIFGLSQQHRETLQKTKSFWVSIPSVFLSFTPHLDVLGS